MPTTPTKYGSPWSRTATAAALLYRAAITSRVAASGLVKATTVTRAPMAATRTMSERLLAASPRAMVRARMSSTRPEATTLRGRLPAMALTGPRSRRRAPRCPRPGPAPARSPPDAVDATSRRSRGCRRGEARHASQGRLGQPGIGPHRGRIARSGRPGDGRDGLSGDAPRGIHDLQHGGTPTGPHVDGQGGIQPVDGLERAQVGGGQIVDVDVVTDGAAVRSRQVRAVDGQRGPSTGGHAQHDGMRLAASRQSSPAEPSLAAPAALK